MLEDFGMHVENYQEGRTAEGTERKKEEDTERTLWKYRENLQALDRWYIVAIADCFITP